MKSKTKLYKREEVPAGVIREIIDLSKNISPYNFCDKIRIELYEDNTETNFQNLSYNTNNDLGHFFRFRIDGTDLVIKEIGTRSYGNTLFTLLRYNENDMGNENLNGLVKGFRLRIGRFKKEKYIHVLNFKEYEGLVAKYFVVLFRRDAFGKENFSLWRRLYKFVMKIPHPVFTEAMRKI